MSRKLQKPIAIPKDALERTKEIKLKDCRNTAHISQEKQHKTCQVGVFDCPQFPTIHGKQFSCTTVTKKKNQFEFGNSKSYYFIAEMKDNLEFSQMLSMVYHYIKDEL